MGWLVRRPLGALEDGWWTVTAAEPGDLGDWLARVLAAGGEAGLGPFEARLRGAQEARRYALEAAGIAGDARSTDLRLTALPARTATALVDAWTAGLDLCVASATRPDEITLEREEATRVTVRVRATGGPLAAALKAVAIEADAPAEGATVAAPGRRPAMNRGRLAAGVAVATVAVLVAAAATARHQPQLPAPATAAGPPVFDVPPAPSASAIASDPLTGGFLVVGCCDPPGGGMQHPAATWNWDGSSWDHLHPALSPPYSRDMALAFDPFAGTFVLSGGDTGPQTWTWNRSQHTWLAEPDAIQPPVGPAAVVGQSVAPHGSTTPLVLVTSGRLGTVQTWSRTLRGWQLVDAAGPQGLIHNAFAPDVVRGNNVLVSNVGTAFSQTSVYDGHRWAAVGPRTSLPSDPNTQLTWDTASRRVLAILPGDSGNVLSGARGTTQTWAWDGAEWSQVEAMGGPGGRGRLLTSWLGVVLFMGDATTDGHPDVMTWTGIRWDVHPGGAGVVLRNPPADLPTLLRSHGLVLLEGPLRGDVDESAAATVAAQALPQPAGPEQLRTAMIALGTVRSSDTGAGLCTCWVWEVLRTTLPECAGLEPVESEAVVLVDAGSNRLVRVFDDPAPAQAAVSACGG